MLFFFLTKSVLSLLLGTTSELGFQPNLKTVCTCLSNCITSLPNAPESFSNPQSTQQVTESAMKKMFDFRFWISQVMQ